MQTCGEDESSGPAVVSTELQFHVAAHSLGWLVLANSIGVLLAALLLWPGLNRLLAPIVYGQWATLHLNLQLYGWCSLPLVGLLFRMYMPRDRAPGAMIALQAWSAALVFASCAWCAGQVSGKPFMEWSGPSRIVMPVAMTSLAIVLIAGYALKLRTDAASETKSPRITKILFLLILAAIPPLMYWASDPAIYPPFNPDSGGSTGGSLLGSTLGVIVIFLACPIVAGLPRRRHAAWLVAWWLLLVIHMIAFSGLDHGNRSHHETLQIIGLSSLVIWWPLLIVYFRWFTRPAASRAWLAAFCFWGAFLLATALLTFMPGILDRWKFTNALVAHTHIAMAGMLSSFLMLTLIALDETGRWRVALASPVAFATWQIGCILHVGSLLVLGNIESENPGLVYYSASAAQLAYAIRLAAGLLMTTASIAWLRGIWRAMRQTSNDWKNRGPQFPIIGTSDPKIETRTHMKIKKSWAYIFCALAGACDATTGLLLVIAPLFTLRLMGIHAVPAEPVFTQYLGAFVGAVGCSYLFPFLLPKGPARDRATEGILTMATIIRIFIATFTAITIARGGLEHAWLSVTGTDATFAIIQIIILKSKVLRSENA